MSLVRNLGGARAPAAQSAPAAPGSAAIPPKSSVLAELDERSREIFRQVVEAYVETGEPVGSRTLSRKLTEGLSPATIRNVMADLQDAGLLYAPHTSAGRLPTDAGLRLFVNGLLQAGALTPEERASIDSRCAADGRSVAQVLEQASSTLAGLSRCASLVLAPTSEGPLKHVEFVNIGNGRALVVLVTANGLVENRVIDLPLGLPASALQQATNYLNARLSGRTFAEARSEVLQELEHGRAELDELTRRVVAAGIATRAGSEQDNYLIVRGQSQLLGDVTALTELERIRQLFEILETRETMVKLLDAAHVADGVQIFIGAESALFGLSGCSVVLSPVFGPGEGKDKIVGAIGVIGPTRINYARVIPMVDYTARVVGRLLG
ncbi:MAG: heat-inducible transcriptional repressor HrcA [Alphaproteobacteria bacterium]|nr:heat-inducible transcriptional repressor HrcA [Alphaproteobacteria bacterium]